MEKGWRGMPLPKEKSGSNKGLCFVQKYSKSSDLMFGRVCRCLFHSGTGPFPGKQ